MACATRLPSSGLPSAATGSTMRRRPQRDVAWRVGLATNWCVVELNDDDVLVERIMTTLGLYEGHSKCVCKRLLYTRQDDVYVCGTGCVCYCSVRAWCVALLFGLRGKSVGNEHYVPSDHRLRFCTQSACCVCDDGFYKVAMPWRECNSIINQLCCFHSNACVWCCSRLGLFGRGKTQHKLGQVLRCYHHCWSIPVC